MSVLVAPEPVLDRRTQAPSARPSALSRRPGASSIASSSVARHCSSSPTARSAEASATRTSTCRSPSAARSSRSVARNQRAATAGARVAAAAPASSRSCDRLLVSLLGRLLDVVRPLARPQRLSPPARPPPARVPRASSRPAPTRRPPCGRAGGERRTAAGPSSGAGDHVRAAHRARRARPRPDSSAIVAARSGSNGSPATAAASSSPRSVAESDVSSSASDAATARGNADPVDPSAAHRRRERRAAARPRELLEIERIAAAVPVDRRRCSRVELAQQLRRLRLAELLEPDPSHGRQPRARPIDARAPDRAARRARTGPRRPARAEAAPPAARSTPRRSSADRRARTTSGRSTASSSNSIRTARWAR